MFMYSTHVEREEYFDKFQDVIPAREIIHANVTKLRWGYHCRKRLNQNVAFSLKRN